MMINYRSYMLEILKKTMESVRYILRCQSETDSVWQSFSLSFYVSVIDTLLRYSVYKFVHEI